MVGEAGKNSVSDLFAAPHRARVLLIAAHPDDETLAAGGLLRRLGCVGASVAVAHATDGAPLDMSDAHAHGFDSRAAYAAARENELAEALNALSIEPQRFRFGFADQSLPYNLAEATAVLTEVLRSYRPTVVLAHPYEGGHPDHDAVALIVSVALTRAGLLDPPPQVEFTSYHLWNGATRVGAFLHDETPPVVLELDEEARQAKERMLRCFVTQRETLGGFDAGARECFRCAPRYDFRQPPHEPPLLYDLFRWRITSREWLARAAVLLDAESASCH
jgi:N-acetylglucosamine malate deacetylase 2